MTEEQKIKIRRMRLDGNGYKHIASTLILPLSTVKSYCKRNGLVGVGPVVATTMYLYSLDLSAGTAEKDLSISQAKKEKFFARTNAENNIGIYITEEKYD
jgi:hypothetical protein